MISGNDSVCADEKSLLLARMKLAEINFGKQVAGDMPKTYKKFAVNFVAYRKL